MNEIDEDALATVTGGNLWDKVRELGKSAVNGASHVWPNRVPGPLFHDDPWSKFRQQLTR